MIFNVLHNGEENGFTLYNSLFHGHTCRSCRGLCGGIVLINHFMAELLRNPSITKLKTAS
jgi:hypothetical protein